MRLVIEIPDEQHPEDVLAEVMRLIAAGFTSGHQPTWELVK